MTAPGDEPLVGIMPAPEAGARRRLLAALGKAWGVSFEGRAPGDWEGLRAVVVFTTPDGAEAALGHAPVDHLVVAAGPANRNGAARAVALSHDEALAAPLRGRRLFRLATVGHEPHPGDRILAAAGGRAVWLRRPGPAHSGDLSVAPIGELHPGEPLRARLCSDAPFSLLPLLHLLDRAVAGAWRRPPLRAAFVLDDPNLHWRSYGHVRYAELVRHARAHGYHVAMATVPLDTWLVHRGTAELFRSARDVLSLAIHGVEHRRQELLRLTDERRAQVLLAGALARIRALEDSSGVPVARVVVPPHGVCSPSSMRALAELGFDALCYNDGPADTGCELGGTQPADIVAGGLPALPRRRLGDGRDELALEAYLGRPLILYGHHWDLAGGLDVLAREGAHVSALGDVAWGSLSAIAESNAVWRREGELLRVRPYSRRLRFAVPEGVRALRVEPVPCSPEAPADRVVVAGGGGERPWSSAYGEPLPVAGGTTIELRLERALPATPIAAQYHPRATWPIVRRLVAEARDRARPVAAHVMRMRP